jgi:hypothetical protein
VRGTTAIKRLAFVSTTTIHPMCSTSAASSSPGEDSGNKSSAIADELFLQRPHTVESRQVLNDAHHRICAVTKALEKQPS